MTNPFSVNSKPGAAGTTGFTPMATRQTSAVISSSCPLLFFTLALTCPSQVSVTDSTEAPVITLMPCFLNARSSVMQESSSSLGSIRGSASISVTLVPNEL